MLIFKYKVAHLNTGIHWCVCENVRVQQHCPELLSCLFQQVRQVEDTAPQNSVQATVKEMPSLYGCTNTCKGVETKERCVCACVSCLFMFNYDLPCT